MNIRRLRQCMTGFWRLPQGVAILSPPLMHKLLVAAITSNLGIS
jgi:hypothetical protein